MKINILLYSTNWKIILFTKSVRIIEIKLEKYWRKKNLREVLVNFQCFNVQYTRVCKTSIPLILTGPTSSEFLFESGHPADTRGVTSAGVCVNGTD